MTKRFHQRMAALLCLLLILIGLFYACKKTETTITKKKTTFAIERFFDIQGVTDSAIIAIAENVKRQDAERHLVDKLIDRAGYPVWNKARVSRKEFPNEKQVFIPLIQENKKQTRAMLIVKIKDEDSSFSLLYNTNAGNFTFKDTKPGTWNAKDIFHAFLLFDNAIFGHTKFTVRNGRLVDDTTGASHKIEIINSPDYTSANSGIDDNRSQNLYPVTTFVTFITCGLCGFRDAEVNAVERCCNATYNTVPVTYWLNEETEEVIYDLPSGYSEGSGSMLCPGCSWEDTNPCDIEPPFTQFCDVEWQPTLHVPDYNAFSYDTIHIETGLETAFPCVASFIRDSLSNANLLAQIAGADVFKDSVHMNLTFDTAYNFTTDTSVNTALTERTSIMVESDGTTTFHAKILLNPWFLRHGTKEFMVANILHEIMHAAFTLRWGQYLDWLQHHDTQYDSFFIKARFPMYWYAIQNRASPLSAQEDHEIMAADYLNQFTNIMTKFYNPNASTAVRDTTIKALAYHGLYKTTAWKALPGQGVDTCKYKGIAVSAERASNFAMPTGCMDLQYVYFYSSQLKLRPACQ